jgi:hypothetical protein
MKSWGKVFLLWVLVFFGIAGLGAPEISQAKEDAVRLHEGLGKHHFRISTHIPMAQRYFDQAMILILSVCSETRSHLCHVFLGRGFSPWSQY